MPKPMVVSFFHLLQAAFICSMIRIANGVALRDRCGSCRSGSGTHSQSPAYPSEIVEYPLYSRLIDRLAFLEPGDRAVLPQDRSRIRKRSLEPVRGGTSAPCGRVPAARRRSSRSGPYLLSRRQRDIHQVQRDHALIEPAVELVIAVGVAPRRQGGLRQPMHR